MDYRKFSQDMRIYHRYLGFFLVGIMTMYSISGIILVYRNTDFLKVTKHYEENVGTNLSDKELGEKIRIRNLQFTDQTDDVATFKEGSYDMNTGVVNYSKKQLPTFLEKLTHFHKAKKGDNLYYFNVFFGLCLLFFVISSLFMFMPRSNAMKKGWYWIVAGMILAIIILYSR